MVALVLSATVEAKCVTAAVTVDGRVENLPSGIAAGGTDNKSETILGAAYADFACAGLGRTSSCPSDMPSGSAHGILLCSWVLCLVVID